MSYTKTTWQNLPNQTTPITATRLNNMENGIKNNDTNIGGEEYSSSSTYAVGDIVRYQEKLYKCITAITTAEAFNSSKWEQSDIIEFLEDGTGAVNTLVTALATPVSGEGEEIELSNTAKKTFDEFAVGGNTKQDIGIIYICDGTETGTYYFTYNNVNYQFTMPTVASGDKLFFDTTNLILSLDGEIITTTTGTSGTLLTFNKTPSPNYPSKITNVGDNINLFDKDNPNIIDNSFLGSAESSSTGYAVRAYTGTKSLYLKCKKNTPYTIIKSLGKRFVAGYTSTLPSVGTEAYNVITNNEGKEINLAANANSEYIVCFFYTTAADTLTSQEILNSIKIQEGTISSSYTPYKYGNFTTKVQNLNFFDAQQEGWTAVNSASSASIIQSKGKITIYQGTDVTNANFRYISPSILLKAGKYYIKSNISNSLNTDTARLQIYSLRSKLNTDFNIALANLSKTISARSFTLSSDTYISAYLYPYQTSTVVTTVFDKIIISKVNIDYVPYSHEIVKFPLEEGQVLHEEDYLADDGIHQKKETIIFDGTETWKTFLSTAGWYYYAGIIDKIKNMTSNNALCSHFIFDGIGNRVSSQTTGHFFFNDSGSREITNGNVTFFTGTSSVTEWTTYLANQYSAGTPVTLEYDLTEEIIVPYTDEQKIAYLQLKTLKSYKNKTYISSTDETSPIYTVEAQRDLSNLFS